MVAVSVAASPRDTNFRPVFLLLIFSGEWLVFALLFLFVAAFEANFDDRVALAVFRTPLGIGLLAGDGVFSLATSSPYYYFWNRRAARLRQSPPEEGEPPARQDVWPPAPRTR